MRNTLQDDWKAIRRRKPPAKKAKEGYPNEIAKDWATLKNLPKYGYILEPYYGLGYGLFRVRIVATRVYSRCKQYRVCRVEVIHAPEGWKKLTKTRQGGAWVWSEEVLLTRGRVQRVLQSHLETWRYEMSRDLHYVANAAQSLAQQLQNMAASDKAIRTTASGIRAHIAQLPTKPVY